MAFLTFASTAIQFRYLIPFWVMGWIALFLAAWIVIKPRRSVGITLAVAVGILLTNARPFARELLQITRAPADDSVTAARKLESLGIRQGDEVATVGFPDWPYDYARIAGIQFALELFGGGPGAKDVAPLSKLPAADVSRILATLRANGAKALFATGRPAFENDTGWVHLTCRHLCEDVVKSFAGGNAVEVIEIAGQMGFAGPEREKRLITSIAEFGAKRGGRGKTLEGFEQLFIRTIDKAAATILNDLGQRAQVADDNRSFARERFDAGQAEGFIRDGWGKAGDGVIVEGAEIALG